MNHWNATELGPFWNGLPPRTNFFQEISWLLAFLPCLRMHVTLHHKVPLEQFFFQEVALVIDFLFHAHYRVRCGAIFCVRSLYGLLACCLVAWHIALTSKLLTIFVQQFLCFSVFLHHVTEHRRVRFEQLKGDVSCRANGPLSGKRSTWCHGKEGARCN